MASLRRSTAPANDATTAKFLYTILKQLDHKSIDWAEVATELEITNGHAARMRFSRFKQHMEGVAPTTRKPRAESHTQRRAKLEKKRKKPTKSKRQVKSEAESGNDTSMDGVGSVELESTGEDGNVKAEPDVKVESRDDDMMDGPSVTHVVGNGISCGYDGAGIKGLDGSASGYVEDMEAEAIGRSNEDYQHIKAEPAVKMEMEDVY